ncbi:MAG: copper resistance protein NlpE [Chitinophagales bacterium]|nr:copper resistance protein NlpE [Chitinophagales bacterium]
MKLILFIIICFLFVAACQTSDQKQVDNSNIQAIDTADNQPKTSFKNEHNAQNSLDWHGTYTGKILLTSEPPIQVELELELDLDGDYELELFKDQQTKTEAKGQILWSSDGQTITLSGWKDGNNQFFVAENYLIQLDQNGNKLDYQLNKVFDED